MGQARIPPSTKDLVFFNVYTINPFIKLESNFFHALMASTNVQGYMMLWMALTSI